MKEIMAKFYADAGLARVTEGSKVARLLFWDGPGECQQCAITIGEQGYDANYIRADPFAQWPRQTYWVPIEKKAILEVLQIHKPEYLDCLDRDTGKLQALGLMQQRAP